MQEMSVGNFVFAPVGYVLLRLSLEEADHTLRLMEMAGVLAEEQREISA